MVYGFWHGGSSCFHQLNGCLRQHNTLAFFKFEPFVLQNHKSVQQNDIRNLRDSKTTFSQEKIQKKTHAEVHSINQNHYIRSYSHPFIWIILIPHSFQFGFWRALQWFCNRSSLATSNRFLYIILHRCNGAYQCNKHHWVGINSLCWVCVYRFAQNPFFHKTPQYQKCSKHRHPPWFHEAHKCTRNRKVAARKNLSKKCRRVEITAMQLKSIC